MYMMEHQFTGVAQSQGGRKDLKVSHVTIQSHTPTNEPAEPAVASASGTFLCESSDHNTKLTLKLDTFEPSSASYFDKFTEATRFPIGLSRRHT